MLWSTYVAEGGASDDHVYPGPITPVFGAYRYCEWRSGAEARLKLLPRASFGPPEKAYGHEAVNHPGFVRWQHGRGQSLQFPWTIGRAYRELGLSVVRDLIVRVVRDLLATDEPISAELPEQVEMTVHHNGASTIIHLVNMSGATRSSFGPPLPSLQGCVRIRGIGKNATAYALVSDSACTLTQQADGVAVEAPPVGLFEVIVIKDQEQEPAQ
jgi:hypothetical protein